MASLVPKAAQSCASSTLSSSADTLRLLAIAGDEEPLITLVRIDLCRPAKRVGKTRSGIALSSALCRIAVAIEHAMDRVAGTDVATHAEIA